MSEWSVRTVKVGKIEKHPNADALSITHVDGGYPCIVRTGEIIEGQLATYVPVDSVVPDTEEWSFLQGRRRIEAKRLRGIFSMGVLRPALDGASEGDDVAEALGITKWLPKMPAFIGGDNEREPEHFVFSKYTDLLALRRYKHVLQQGEEVVLTEKIHGACAKYVHDGERLWVGSRNCVKKDDERSVWWKVARKHDLERKLKHHPFMIIFGEVFGNVQDLKYGMPNDVDLRVFDVRNAASQCYIDFEDALELSRSLELPWVPLLFSGPWEDMLISAYANGPTSIKGATHTREGFVVRPRFERWDQHLGRVILKHAGEDYLTRKNKADFID